MFGFIIRITSYVATDEIEVYADDTIMSFAVLQSDFNKQRAEESLQRVKSIVYLDELNQTISWHDGSRHCINVILCSRVPLDDKYIWFDKILDQIRIHLFVREININDMKQDVLLSSITQDALCYIEKYIQ
jgi:hypothetical protein